MKHLALAFLAVSALTQTSLAADKVQKPDHFGSTFTQTQTTNLPQVVKQADQYKKTPALLEAEVKQVCVKKGCWMTIENGGTSVRVVFKDYSFFVPKRLVGQKVKIEGLLEEKEMSVKDQQHFLKDAGASDKEIAAVTAAKKEFQFVATAVEKL